MVTIFCFRSYHFFFFHVLILFSCAMSIDIQDYSDFLSFTLGLFKSINLALQLLPVVTHVWKKKFWKLLEARSVSRWSYLWLELFLKQTKTKNKPKVYAGKENWLEENNGKIDKWKETKVKISDPLVVVSLSSIVSYIFFQNLNCRNAAFQTTTSWSINLIITSKKLIVNLYTWWRFMLKFNNDK